MVTSVLSAVQKVYSGARKNLTLASMNHKYNRALSGKGSGVGRVHISRFTTPSDAQAILTRAQYIKEVQKDFQNRSKRMKLPSIHAPHAQLQGLTLHERSTILEGANLQHANLSKADLRGASFQGANLVGANLTEANLNDVKQKGKQWITSFEGANLQGTDFTQALLSKKALATGVVQEDTKLPKQFTAERSGYTYLGGDFNQGVKVSPKFTTKVLGSYHPPEVENMQIIQKRLKDFETHQPELAQKLKLGEKLVHYKGHFIPKQEPEKLYLVMDTAKGTPLRDTNLSKADRDKVQKSVNAYNKLLKENLGFILGDRNQGNLFVQLDEQGQLKLDEAGEPMIQHIDYGIIHWY